MRPVLAFLLAGAASVANGAAVPQARQASPAIDYDTVIIGGGPAGLSALSGLARVRRKVLLIDSGEYRNAPTRHMHDVLGFDGVTPAYFRYAARQQITHYTTITFANGTVTSITPGDDLNTFFTLTTTTTLGPDSGSYTPPTPESIRTLTTRKVVLATGLRDLLPTTPGISQYWGQGIFWCPWCDGHEHADQPLGLLGTLDNVPGAVREMVTLNSQVTAFVNGSDTPAYRAINDRRFPGWERYLAIHNVTVDNRTIGAITRLRDGTPPEHGGDPSLPSVAEFDLFRVEFEEGGGSVETVGAFLAAFPSEQRSRVGEEAGVQLYGGRLAADPATGLVTNVAGIYAIGDANSDNVTNVPHALFSGKRTAVYLHVKLAREDAEKELNGTASTAVGKRDDLDMELEARSLWGVVNGSPEDDMLHAGEFDS